MKTETKRRTANSLKQNHKLLTGETSGKYAVLLDDGKTIIFVSDKSKEAETRLKYKKLLLNVKI